MFVISVIFSSIISNDVDSKCIYLPVAISTCNGKVIGMIFSGVKMLYLITQLIHFYLIIGGVKIRNALFTNTIHF